MPSAPPMLTALPPDTFVHSPPLALPRFTDVVLSQMANSVAVVGVFAELLVTLQVSEMSTPQPAFWYFQV